MLLNGKNIQKLIEKENLIENYIHLDTQITPNGFDLTVEKIFEFDNKGMLDFSNSERKVPKGKKLTPRKKEEKDKYGWWVLNKGIYKLRTNEILNLPKKLIAIPFSRTSLLRMGARISNAVGNAGFKGKAEFLLIVGNEKGIEIKENARICQMIFFTIPEVEKGYDGIWQNLT